MNARASIETAPHLTTIPLVSLRVSPFNIRVPETDTPAYRQLVASIAAHGLLEPLVVRPVADEPDHFEVLQGGNRLMALRELAGGDEARSVLTEVPCQVLEGLSDTEAREVSLATAVVRSPLNPVAEYEAFSALEAEGLNEHQIAARFGISARGVRQRLALGKLVPEARDLWRAGTLTFSDAAALTLAPDEAAQRAVLEAMAKQSFHPTQSKTGFIKRLLLVEEERETVERSHYFQCIGEEAYLAAGGTITENLFDEERIVNDGALAKRLAREKALTAADEHRAKHGFGAILWGDDMENKWSWPRLRNEPVYTAAETERLAAIATLLDAELPEDETDEQAAAAETEYERLQEEADAITDAAASRAWSAEDKARSAVVASIKYDGTILLEEGYLISRSDRAQSGTGDRAQSGGSDRAQSGASAQKDEPKTVSATLLQEVSEGLTTAAVQSLTATPVAALPLLLATLRCAGSPLKVNLSSRMARPSGFKPGSLAEEITRLVKLPAEEVADLLAAELARGLNLTDAAIGSSHYASNQILQDARKAVMVLLDALDPAFQQRLRTAFDPAAYFAAAPKAEAVRALDEMGIPPPKLTGKKAEVADAAALHGKAQGWLPDMMRTSSYALLGDALQRAQKAEAEAKAKAAKPAKAAKAKPAKPAKAVKTKRAA